VHIYNDKAPFKSLRYLQPREHKLQTAGNEALIVTETGTVEASFNGNHIQFMNVVYVPNCSNNLLSLPTLTLKGYMIAMSRKDSIINYNGKPVITAYPKSYLYLAYADEIANRALIIPDATDTKDRFLWHARLGHIPRGANKKASTLVSGITLRRNSPSECTCKACILGQKFHRSFHLSSTIKLETKNEKREVLSLVHSDVAGPLPESRTGKRYLVTYTDEAIKAFRTDRGGEYTALANYFHLKGIEHQTIAPYTPECDPIPDRQSNPKACWNAR
jgi:hypothetical protein